MSEAIIARAGKSGGQVDLSGINSSLSSINSKITTINSKINSINNSINDIWDELNNSGGDIPIYGDKCSIVVTAKDSSGAPFEGITISCLDGSSWYNYLTNSQGQALFVTNSGSANFIAWNANVEGNYKYIDQAPVIQNVDAPTGTSKNITMQLSRISTKEYSGAMNNNIFNNTAMFGGNHKVRVSNYVNIFLGGAGSGGWGSNCGEYGTRSAGKGGYGGGITIVNNIALNKNNNYLFYVSAGGSGGREGHYYNDIGTGSYGKAGGTGGTTSAFGYSATGGSSTTWGTGNYNGGGSGGSYPWITGLDSEWSNWGGDGGRGSNNGSDGNNGGNPYGGKGGDNKYDGREATNGGGGGGAGGGQTSSWGRNGGDGGPGKINLVLR